MSVVSPKPQRSAWRRIARTAGRSAAAVVLLAALAALLAARSPLPDRMVPWFTAAARTEGLALHWGGTLTARRIELRDAAGTYATLDGVRLAWSPLRLLRGTIALDRLRVRAAVLRRLPQSAGAQAGGGLPARIALRRLEVDRFVLAPGLITGVAGARPAPPAVFRLTGSGRADGPDAARIALTATEIAAGPGAPPAQGTPAAGARARYSLRATMTAAGIDARLDLTEPAGGPLARLSGIAGAGPLAVTATARGPRGDLATRLDLAAGPLRLAARGTVDLADGRLDLAISGTAPAMAPAPGVSWHAATLAATARGPFAAPRLTGLLRLDRLAAAGATAQRVTLDLTGEDGAATVSGTLEGLRLPGPDPALLAGAPLRLTATAKGGTASLTSGIPAVRFTVSHPLFGVRGTLRLAAPTRLRAAVTLPRLSPFAALAGVALDGAARLTLHATLGATQPANAVDLALTGTLGLTGGAAPLPALLGPAAQLAFAGSYAGGALTIRRFALTGPVLSLAATGAAGPARIDLGWQAGLAALSALNPRLAGHLQGSGSLSGTPARFGLAATLSGIVTPAGLASPAGATAPGGFTARLAVRDLPEAPQATLTADGALLGAPLRLTAAARRGADGTVHLNLDQAAWRSATAEGALTLAPGAALPLGTLRLSVARLADLAPLLGRALSGSLRATLAATAAKATLTAEARDAALPGTGRVTGARLSATVTDPTTRPRLDGRLALTGIDAGGFAGTATLTAQGPLGPLFAPAAAEAGPGPAPSQGVLALRLTAAAPALDGAPARLDATASVRPAARTLSLQTLNARWRGQVLHLRGPAEARLIPGGVAIAGLRAGLAGGAIAVDGTIGPTLALTASLRGLQAGQLARAVPGLRAAGLLSAEARLRGSLARPEGTLRAEASGLRLLSGPGQALPPGQARLTATLAGTTARLDARATLGASFLSLTGTAPLAATAPLALRAGGTIDLALADPLLAAAGQRVAGQVRLDATIAGTATAPRLAGGATLAGGAFRDAVRGVRISAIAGKFVAEGDRLRILRLTGRAGDGTLDAEGTLGVLQAGLPADLRLRATDATPLAGGVVTATVDAALTLSGSLTPSGPVAQRELLAGTVRVRSATVRIPNQLPADVPLIPVRVAGAPPAAVAPPPTPGPALALDLTVAAPQQVFVRGRGLNAELGGTVYLRGSTARVIPQGAFKLIRGTFALAGQTLNFTSGQIGFEGGSLTNPALDLVASSTANAVTATLTVGGTAQAPRITLSSVPELPQDQVLAQLLFHTEAGRLTPLQLAGIAAGLAQISGGTSDLPNPLEGLRNALGLSQLGIASGASGTAGVHAGRYIGRRLYVGVRQGFEGTAGQGTATFEITPQLKLHAAAGTGQTTSAIGASGQTSGESVGITYQFGY